MNRDVYNGALARQFARSLARALCCAHPRARSLIHSLPNSWDTGTVSVQFWRCFDSLCYRLWTTVDSLLLFLLSPGKDKWDKRLPRDAIVLHYFVWCHPVDNSSRKRDNNRHHSFSCASNPGLDKQDSYRRRHPTMRNKQKRIGFVESYWLETGYKICRSIFPLFLILKKNKASCSAVLVAYYSGMSSVAPGKNWNRKCMTNTPTNRWTNRLHLVELNRVHVSGNRTLTVTRAFMWKKVADEFKKICIFA